MLRGKRCFAAGWGCVMGVVHLFLALIIVGPGAFGQVPTACQLPAGTIVDSMESVGQWKPGSGNGAKSLTLSSAAGCRGQGILLTYDLGTQKGAYVQIRRDFNPPLDFSASDLLRLQYRGTTPNTIEIGMVDSTDQNYFATSWNESTGVPWCNSATWDLKDFRKNDTASIDLGKIRVIFISVTYNANGVGGAGSFLVDEIEVANLSGRRVAGPEAYKPDDSATLRAAAWIGARQQPNGLLKSWLEEVDDNSWLYDQALGILVLLHTDRERARLLVDRILALQNKEDGSWYQGYHYKTTTFISTQKDMGSIAWLVYALSRYAILNPDSPSAAAAQEAAINGAKWIALQQDSSGRVSSSTEANLDAWWALRGAGLTDAADRLKNFIITQLWDGVIGRFKSDVFERRIFLDNQTWGAPFLRAMAQDQSALQALSYARAALAVQSSSTVFGSVCGLDGAGPFGVWNEGTLEYITEQGEFSQLFYDQVLRQQGPDGGIPGSPLDNDLRAYIVWLTKWHGIAPTAWFYFAGAGSPFVPRLTTVNSASLIGPTVAVGSIVSGFGKQLVPGCTVSPDGKALSPLGDTVVKVRDSQGVERNGNLYAVCPEQINYVLPSNSAVGSATITVLHGPLIVTHGTAELARVVPTIYTCSGNGRGAAAGIALHVLNVTNQQVPTYLADPGKTCAVIAIDMSGDDQTILILFGTGIRNGTSVSAKVGNSDATVLYFGPQNEWEGLDQVNILVSPTLQGAGTLDVVLTVDGLRSNPVSVAFR